MRDKDTDIEHVLPPVAGLIGDAPTLLPYVDLDGNPRRLDYRHHAALDRMPLPMPVDREGYGTVESTPRYWASGLADWFNVREALHRHGPAADAPLPLRLLDFGCATGRFLRHVWTQPPQAGLDLWGCDFSPQNVAWSRRYLDPAIKVILNLDVPHLPFPDRHFAVVTAFSVFTHIDVLEDPWLLELRRITRDVGLLYLTVHNEASWQEIRNRPGALARLRRAREFPGNPGISDSTFDRPMPRDRLVFAMSRDGVYNCNVWSSSRYIRERWGRFFDVLAIADRAHDGYQSVVLLRPSPD